MSAGEFYASADPPPEGEMECIAFVFVVGDASMDVGGLEVCDVFGQAAFDLLDGAEMRDDAGAVGQGEGVEGGGQDVRDIGDGYDVAGILAGACPAIRTFDDKFVGGIGEHQGICGVELVDERVCGDVVEREGGDGSSIEELAEADGLEAWIASEQGCDIGLHVGSY